MPTIKEDCLRNSKRIHASARRLAGLSSEPNRIYIFTHHKVATVLLSSIFRNLSASLNMSMCRAYGSFEYAPNFDVVLFEHSLVGGEVWGGDFRGVHIRRDPREVLASSYLYHKRTNEEWCNSAPNDLGGPIGYPRIDYVREHYPEPWKAEYLQGLNGRSYKENLLSLPTEDGLIFELDRYAGWTILDMCHWGYNDPRVLELKFENLVEDLEGSLFKIFTHLGARWWLSKSLSRAAKRFDVRRMSDEQIARNAHISGRDYEKWRTLFTERVQEEFESRFPNAVERLGYEA